MDDEERATRNGYRNIKLAEMQPVWSIPSQCAFTQVEVLQMINNHLGQDGGQLDEIFIQEPGGPFA